MVSFYFYTFVKNKYMIDFRDVVKERKKVCKSIFDKCELEKEFNSPEETAFEIYDKCRRNHRFFKHKRALKTSILVINNTIRVMYWNSPSYKMKKIHILQEYWESVLDVIYDQAEMSGDRDYVL